MEKKNQQEKRNEQNSAIGNNLFITDCERERKTWKKKFYYMYPEDGKTKAKEANESRTDT